MNHSPFNRSFFKRFGDIGRVGNFVKNQAEGLFCCQNGESLTTCFDWINFKLHKISLSNSNNALVLIIAYLRKRNQGLRLKKPCSNLRLE